MTPRVLLPSPFQFSVTLSYRINTLFMCILKMLMWIHFPCCNSYGIQNLMALGAGRAPTCSEFGLRVQACVQMAADFV